MARRNLSVKPGAERSRFRPDVILEFTATEDSPITLLDFLFAVMPDRKKSAVKAFLKYEQVKINATVTTRFDFPVTPGDIVAVNTSRQWQTLKNPRLKILYEDDDIIVVHKGYGLLSMGNDKKKDGTAYSILRDYVKRIDPRNKIFIVHRLDQHTSGLMVFAKTEEAKNNLQHNWNNMVLERRYLAIVEGRPEEREGMQKSYLSENDQHIVFSSDTPKEGSQLAVTHWKALRSHNGYTLMEVSLDTGRKNQIRVHMKDLGHPIVGDKKYGARTSPIHRLALHAATLRFVHPVTRRDMNFTSAPPASFDKLV
ncbi:MAG: RluA family pseudouridine synthase [Muribaculaceae bacterium]|nr:RluA family pseudouridine synthase [Muribaculaceae bacterium]